MPEGTFNLNKNQGNQPHQITPEELAAGTPTPPGKSPEQAPAQTQPVVAPPIIDAMPASAVTPPPIAAPPMATPPPERPKSEGNAKKYIIIAIVVIILLTGAYFAYSFFMNDSAGDETETEEVEKSGTANKLGDDSDKTKTKDAKDEDGEKLEELTEELESTFGDEAASEEPTGEEDAPPSLSIGGPESTESETESAGTKEPETPEASGETVTTEGSEASDTTETDDEKIFR